MRLKSLALVMALIAVLAVAVQQLPMHELFLASADAVVQLQLRTGTGVVTNMNIFTLGPDPVTILDSDSGKINVSLYSYKNPNVYTSSNSSQVEINVGFTGSSEVTPGVITDTYVYLPQGPEYTVTIRNGWSIGRE